MLCVMTAFIDYGCTYRQVVGGIHTQFMFVVQKIIRKAAMQKQFVELPVDVTMKRSLTRVMMKSKEP